MKKRGRRNEIMKTAMLIGTGDLIFKAADLLNPKELKLIGFGTTVEENWNVFDENGDIKNEIDGIPVMPIDLAAGYNPDLIIAAAKDEDENNALKYMIYRTGFQNEVVFLKDICEEFSVRTASLRRLSQRINALGIKGSVAEAGCFRGDTSWQLNALFPDRKLYLFDTFTGYDERDVFVEKKLACSDAEKGGKYAFRDPEGRIEKLKARLPHVEMADIRPGWFPESAADLEEEKFAFVYMDMQLYLPTFSGIEFFFPRMAEGGIIVLAGYGDPVFHGVRQAVADLEEKYGAFLMVPSGDLDETVFIIQP